jgi:hypothetical protein
MKCTIKCDVMSESWNYDDCVMCRHYSGNLTAKGRIFRCKLNSNSASEKREFNLIWGHEYLRAHGVKLSEDEITVVYIGKKKRKPKSKERLPL